MFCTDLLRFLGRGSDQGPSGQVIGFPEESSGPLVDGGDGLFTEETMADPCDFEMVV